MKQRISVINLLQMIDFYLNYREYKVMKISTATIYNPKNFTKYISCYIVKVLVNGIEKTVNIPIWKNDAIILYPNINFN